MANFTVADRIGGIGGYIGGIAALTGAMNGGCGCNNGLLGGLLGGNNCPGDCPVTEKEFAWAQAFNAKEAELAAEKAERYADTVGTAAYREAVAMSNATDAKQAALFKELSGEIINQSREIAVLKADLRAFSVDVDHRITSTNERTASAIALEAERRAGGDKDVQCWVQAQDYVKGVLKIDGSQICCAQCSPCDLIK